MGTWWNSPQLVLALFPEWFAPPQADWPAQTRKTGELKSGKSGKKVTSRAQAVAIGLSEARKAGGKVPKKSSSRKKSSSSRKEH